MKMTPWLCFKYYIQKSVFCWTKYVCMCARVVVHAALIKKIICLNCIIFSLTIYILLIKLNSEISISSFQLHIKPSISKAQYYFSNLFEFFALPNCEYDFLSPQWHDRYRQLLPRHAEKFEFEFCIKHDCNCDVYDDCNVSCSYENIQWIHLSCFGWVELYDMKSM